MEFEFRFGHSTFSANLFELIILGLPVLVYILVALWILCKGIRILRGKPTNAPPSSANWAAVEADVLSAEEGDVWVSTPESFQFAGCAKSGTPIRSDKGYAKSCVLCKIRYSYCGTVYAATVKDPLVRNGKTTIYCDKSNPEKTRVFVPQYAGTKSAGVLCLLVSIVQFVILAAAVRAFIIHVQF